MTGTSFTNMLFLSIIFFLLSVTTMLRQKSSLVVEAFMSHEFSSPRYFTNKGMLPPLNRVGSIVHQFSSTTTTTTTKTTRRRTTTNSTMGGDYTTDTSSYLAFSNGASVPVTYTNDPKTVSQWMTEHLPKEGCIIGFDIESLPRGIKHGEKPIKRSPFLKAATVQLATTDSCLVVHLIRRSSGKHSWACAPILKAVLCDERFIKVGCALEEDFMDLYDLWGGLDGKSRFDLGLLGGRGNQFGLKGLSKNILDLDLPKPKEIAKSDWSTLPLSEDQIIYSARDAWAGVAIAERLATYDPDNFSYESLVSILPQTEPPISELISKRHRRDRAKQALKQILARYPDRHRIPPSIQVHVRELRRLIKIPVIEPRQVLDVSHLIEMD